MKTEAQKVEFDIKKHEPTYVTPAEETKKGLYFLSNTDQISDMKVRTIYCFKSDTRGNEDACEVIKKALSKILVHYYPLAGRITTNSEGKIIVDCTADGALFVEAEANCEIKEITKLENTFSLGELVYDISGDRHLFQILPLVVQVTKFKCGGIVLGLHVNHCMFDGIGAMEFVNAWAETARGLPLKLPPFMDRTILKSRNPPKIEFQHKEEFDEIEDISNTKDHYQEELMLSRSFYFDREKLDRLKKSAMEEGVVQSTTFQVLVALIWKSRCKALGMLPDQKIKLYFAVDVRKRLEPPIPQGYFGNATLVASSSCNASEILNEPLSYTVERVQKAVNKIDNRYARSRIDSFEITRVRPTWEGTLLITSWTKLDLHMTNFGWGNAVLSGPVGWPIKEVVFFLYARKGISVALKMPASAMKIFEDLIMQTSAH